MGSKKSSFSDGIHFKGKPCPPASGKQVGQPCPEGRTKAREVTEHFRKKRDEEEVNQGQPEANGDIEHGFSPSHAKSQRQDHEGQAQGRAPEGQVLV